MADLPHCLLHKRCRHLQHHSVSTPRRTHLSRTTAFRSGASGLLRAPCAPARMDQWARLYRRRAPAFRTARSCWQGGGTGWRLAQLRTQGCRRKGTDLSGQGRHLFWTIILITPLLPPHVICETTVHLERQFSLSYLVRRLTSQSRLARGYLRSIALAFNHTRAARRRATGALPLPVSSHTPSSAFSSLLYSPLATFYTCLDKTGSTAAYTAGFRYLYRGHAGAAKTRLHTLRKTYQVHSGDARPAATISSGHGEKRTLLERTFGTQLHNGNKSTAFCSAFLYGHLLYRTHAHTSIPFHPRFTRTFRLQRTGYVALLCCGAYTAPFDTTRRRTSPRSKLCRTA